MKKKIKYLLVFIFAFVFVFVYNYFYYPINGDEIWNYGFAFNIASGLVPYRDFNMVITPMYSFIVSFFISLFGNHLYIMHIFNSIIVSLMVLIMYKKIGKYVFLFFPLLINIAYPGYNIFTLFLVIILVNFLDNNYFDIVLGIIVSFLLLCKQNIGLVFLVPLFFCSKNKLKSFVSFIIPVSVFILYLFFNNAVDSFINYCFLGLFDFGSNNSIFMFLPISLIICIILLFIFVKSKFQDSFCLIVMCYQFIAYPIFDHSHFGLALFLFLYYILLKFNIIYILNKYIHFFYLFVLITLFIVNNIILNYYFSFKNFYFYYRENSYLNGRIVGSVFNKELKIINNEFENILNMYDYSYFFSEYAYLIKLELGIEINSYDLINNGNMGYRGDKKIIEDVEYSCSNHACLFILDNSIFSTSQLNRKIVEYVKDNYKKIDELGDFDFYANE